MTRPTGSSTRPATFGEAGLGDPETFRTAAKREYRLHSLIELSRELTVSLDPYKIVDLVLLNLMGQGGVSRAVLWMKSDASIDSMVPMRHYGVRKQSAWAIGSICAKHLRERARELEQPVDIDELATDLGPSDARLIEEANLVLFAPIVSHGEFQGMAALGKRIGGELYDAVDRKVIQSCLGMLSVSLDNASLYNRLREKHRQLRQANEDLKQLDQLRSEFMRNVNHELRTPLTVIMAYLDMLLSGPVDEPQRQEFLQTAMREGEKLVGLLERLLDFSALAEGTLPVCLEVGDLNAFVRCYHAERLPGIVEGIREFIFVGDETLPPAEFDPQRIRQILDALLDNAAKFTPQGSRITMAVTQVVEDETEWLKVDVADNGPGIPAERLSDLFLPFHQIDGSMQRTVGGMGIGLALAKELANRMGGDLRVTSEVGEGSVFSLLLPPA
jgi:signal transduction histidine kinase